MRHTLPREFYVPKGAVKVADKNSDAVAYLAPHPTKPWHRAVVFVGNQSKPLLDANFTTPAAREERVRTLFQNRRGAIARKAEQQAARKAEDRGLEVGDIVVSSWGYNRTNVDAFQVTALIGRTMVELRKINCATIKGTEGNYGPYSGDCVPVKDSFAEGRQSETLRKVAKSGAVSLDDTRYASKWDGVRHYYYTSD